MTLVIGLIKVYLCACPCDSEEHIEISPELPKRLLVSWIKLDLNV